MDSDVGSMGQEQNLSGTRLGKYQVRRVIARGGMGTVYQGYDPALDRLVALKVMAPHLTWEESFVQRFVREARAAAKLRHPNIVTIHDVGRVSGWYYFAMDYVEGKTLAQLIDEHGPMALQDALNMLRPLAAALDYAHRQGLVHRDVKPSNVIIGDEGHVTLMDFGIVRASRATRLTTSGAILGTPEYMAPEQARGDDVDRQADQYALAVVAYEMLAGDAPFKAESTPTLLYKIVHEGPPPLRAARPDLPEAVEQTLTRALAKEGQNRYGSCTEFVHSLAQASLAQDNSAQAGLTRARPAQGGLPRAPASGQTPAPPRPAGAAGPDRPVKDRDRRVLLGLGGVGLLVIGLLCLFVAGAGVVIGLLALNDAGEASPSATNTPLSQRAAVTSSPLLPATATSAEPTATAFLPPTSPPTEAPSSRQGSILLQDDFDDPRSGWEVGDYDLSSVGYRDDSYYVVSGAVNWMWGVANKFFTDLVIEVDATQASAGPKDNNDYGVACRVQPNGDGYYLLISGDGYYAIYVRDEAVFAPLLDFQPSDVIRQGNATNHIRAVCNGPTLSLFVNEHHLATVEDTTFAGGDIALTATSYEDVSTEILFDDLVVYAVSE